MRTVYERRNSVPPWVWIAIALGLLLVILVVWMVAAGSRQADNERYGTETVPGESPMTPTTPAPPQATTPSVAPPSATSTPLAVPSIPREQQVRVYIREQRPNPPVVVAVPERAKKPAAEQGYQAIDLPGKFNLFDKEWDAVPGALLMAESETLQDTASEIEGRPVYVMKNDREPYDALYVETTTGSGNFIKYQAAQ